MSERRTQRSRSEATQAALVAAARAMFGRAGFINTNTAELVATASVTRGALYHHFADKEALFEAVALHVATEVSGTASALVQALDCSPWQRFRAALRTYLEVVAERPEAQRILLIDGPAVLGWERWQYIQAKVMLQNTIDGITRLMGEGTLRPGEAKPLAHLILAALDNAALMIANAPDPQAARLPVSDALMQLIDGLALHPNEPARSRA